MEMLLLLLAFPIIWPFIAKKIWKHEITWAELAINIFGIVVLVMIVWFFGRYDEAADTELWNGQITGKDRVHDTYMRSYQCNCYNSCTGRGESRTCIEVCQTCYERRYTVHWFAKANFGMGDEQITFRKLDRTSRSVYNSPDPEAYTRCVVGEPASKSSGYTNYIQAAPDSLFNTSMVSQYSELVPKYPTVHSIYKINRILSVGNVLPNNQVEAFNDLLNKKLIDLGPKKQVNIIVILTDILDPTFRHAVENEWLGGKKNDVVVFLGIEGGNIRWADVMTFALNFGNEIFHVTLRDALQSMDEFDYEKVANVVASTIDTTYDRVRMSDFEYLKDEISPPNWVIFTCLFLAIFGSVGLSLIMRRLDIGGTRRYTRRRANIRRR